MKDMIDKMKSAILHHGTTGFEEIEEVNIYANEGDDAPIISGFAVHVDELPEPVIFQGSGYAAAEDMARAYVAMRRVIPEVIEQLEEQEEEIERLREELQREREIGSLAAEAIESTAASEEFHRETEKKGFYDE